MSINQLYHTWLIQIRQLRPNERITRVRIFAWMATGIFLCRSVHLSYIAGKIPGTATNPSKTRRLSRFLDNDAIRVREWYEPTARQLLESLAERGQQIRLILDGTKIGFGHQLLMVAVAYRRRAIPIAWTWVKSPRGHSSDRKQLALLAYVHSLIPTGARVLAVGDSEFGGVPVIQQMEHWHWQYVLRQKGNVLVRRKAKRTWQAFRDFIRKPGQSVWLGAGSLTEKYAHPVHLLAHWQLGEEEPWLLATNLESRQATLQAYARRMWLEEMFGDLKKHGFDLEGTHLRHFLRLSRLTLIAALVYVWLISFGSQVIKNGKRRLVDRADRQDLSIFRIGFDMAVRCLTNEIPLSIRLLPYF